MKINSIASPSRAWETMQGRSGWAGTTVAQFAILGLGVMSGVASGRLLGPQGRGELAAITLWPFAFVYLVSMGLNQAIVFYSGGNRRASSEVLTATGLIGVVQSVLVICVGAALLPLLLREYSESIRHLAQLFLLCTPALILGGYPGNVFQGKQDLFRFNLLRMIAPGVYAAGVVALLILRRPSLPFVLCAQASGFVLALAVGCLFVFRQEAPDFLWGPSTAADLLTYGVKSHLSNLASYLNQRVDQLVLSLLIPAAQLGLYAVAVTIAMSVTFFPAAVGLVVFSHGSNQAEIEIKRSIGKSLRISLLWLALGCSSLFFLVPFLIPAVLGSRFSGSILACKILLPGMLVWGLNQVLYSGANAMHKPILPSYAEGVGIVITIVGLALLVPRYGYVGAAIVSTVSYSTSFLVMLLLAKYRMKIDLCQLFFNSGEGALDVPVKLDQRTY